MGEHDAIDEFMCENVDELREYIISELSSSFPQRAKFLKDALKSHDQKLYSLSIPVFLAQADGITSEIFGRNYFRKYNKSFVEKLATDTDCDDSRLWIESLAHKGSMNGTNNKENLDRHRVMHGTDLEYDTRRKSLQALSFLDYLIILSETKEIIPNNKSVLTTSEVTPPAS